MWSYDHMGIYSFWSFQFVHLCPFLYKIVDDKIFISGAHKGVLKAESVIFETTTVHNFTAELMHDCTGKICVVGFSNLKHKYSSHMII